MKSLTINNRTFYYDNYVDRYMNPTTDFYEGIEKGVRKKYFLFGEKITITKQKYVFSLGIDIESPYLSKEDVRKYILKEIKILDRTKEIENGEII
jgi:hypothetical protein